MKKKIQGVPFQSTDQSCGKCFNDNDDHVTEDRFLIFQLLTDQLIAC